jgi:hypothetical protein
MPRFPLVQLQLVDYQPSPDTIFQQADELPKATSTFSFRRSQESKKTYSLRDARAFHKLFVLQLLKRGIHCRGFIAHKRCDPIRAGQNYPVSVHES